MKTYIIKIVEYDTHFATSIYDVEAASYVQKIGEESHTIISNNLPTCWRGKDFEELKKIYQSR